MLCFYIMIRYLECFDVVDGKLEFSLVNWVLKIMSQKDGFPAASILSPFSN